MNLIDEFLMYYANEFDFYHEAAHQAAMVCESVLQKNGIRANVTYRAKQVESLREKIIRRKETKMYCTKEDILADLVVLSGVRIAVYFPSDKEEIGRLICQEFVALKLRSSTIFQSTSLPAILVFVARSSAVGRFLLALLLASVSA